MPNSKRTRRKRGFTAKTADRHILYQLSVQDAAAEAGFLNRVFRKLRGREPESLREDFCGTALLCSEWVKYRNRTAVGIDLDRSVLEWARGTISSRSANGEDACASSAETSVHERRVPST